MPFFRLHGLGLAALVATLLPGALMAAGELTLAHVAPLTGPVSKEAVEYNLGIRVALKAANAAGGIHGRQLVLQDLDDEYKPEKALARFNEAASSEALAALMPVGSLTFSRILKERLPETRAFPVIGVVPGAQPLREPLNPYVFHVRASDQEQYRKLAEHATSTGLKRIAVAYADVPFGHAGLATLEALFKGKTEQLVAKAALPVGSKAEQLVGAVQALGAAQPDIVYLVSPSQLAGEFVKAYRSKGITAQLATPSYGNAESLCQIAGEDATRGIVIAQVMPNLNNAAIPLVRRFQDDFRKYADAGVQPTVFHLEAYATTRVVLEGLRLAGPAPTRAKLAQALEGMKKFDLGGFPVEYSAARHAGSHYVDISIVGRGCRLMF
ncbi:ABC transporter substrate-binding protein [Zoogloea dura]|uniref:ABC transporter substrate-binding protein n=1 Tax=Zoogloea dura TaxID=2728840 RepID=A0A848G9K0_9RHOO|nr:ABC transporter substrate-binding protein [Zoogloea dura]NML27575.1 ABC transporter substrate-binding protein [Zoogloea dura]